MNLNENQVELIGVLDEDFEYCNDNTFTFLQSYIKVMRLSGATDTIKVICRSDKANGFKMGDRVHIKGELRTHNDNKSVDLSVYILEMESTDLDDMNEVELSGRICKSPYYHQTSKGRDVTNMLVAINRAYHKSSYIPCIAWGSYAKMSKEYTVGSAVKCFGRIQSREYVKDDNIHTTLEVSTYSILLI